MEMTFTCKDIKEMVKKAKAIGFAFDWKVEYFVTGQIKGKCYFDSNGQFAVGKNEEFFAHKCRAYNLENEQKQFLIVENASFFTKRYTVKNVSGLMFYVRMRED